MLRFILKRRFQESGTYFETFETTTDGVELDKLLRSGGRNENGDFLIYELVGVEVLSPS